MRMPEHETACGRARPYYYDFLCGHKTADIPDTLWRHIGHCEQCRTEVDRLTTALAQEATDPGADLAVAAVTANLELHMALMGQPVDCDVVKPFLAPMADPVFEVRGPTPVTVHLQECQACADDLAAVRRLDVTHAQRCRLGRMLAETGNLDPEICTTARNAVAAVATLTFDDVDPEILRHICICPDCRGLLFQRRQTLCDALPPHHAGNGLSCENITSKDLFDLCLPYDLDPAAGPRTESSPSLLAHVSSCRQCMDKMQAMLHTVTHVMDRPNSGIVTSLTMADLSRMRPSAPPSPVPVDLQPEPGRLADRHPDPTPNPQKPRTYLKLRRFLKPAAAAAAVLLVAMLALHGTSLRATDLGEVYAKLAEVDTMHLKRINPERSEVLQEVWMSRNMKIFKDNGQYVVWDLDGKVKTVKNSLTGESQTVPLDNVTVRKVAATLIGPMHVLPFSKLSDTPEGATWHRLEEEPADAVIRGMEVYEMVWTDKALGGAPVYRKWRGYVQPETKLPVRTEYYSRPDTGAEYELLQVSEIAYPGAVFVQEMLRQIGL